MQPNYLTRLLVGGTTLALLNASFTLPVAARKLVAVNGQGARHAALSNGSGNQSNSTFGNSTSGSGTLLALAGAGKQLGQCPLKHTDVQADISGYVARVTVKQTFQNPFKDKIEAVYTFPLSENGAVDEMTMKVGTRTIKGSIKKREEAREIYDQALANGQVASLLDQERTNIFTQSVANIEPGKEIEITIKYVETLPYEAGKYSFTFPTVVGPRFNPGNSIGKSGTGRSDDTTSVPDASKITPGIALDGQRAGHDISIAVHLNAGMPISQISSKLHEIQVSDKGTSEANIALVDKAAIPNKDFVLSWNVAQDSLKSGYLTYRDPKQSSGYFTLMMVPPKRVTPAQVAPKEMIFVIDCSGSQSGAPLDKCKETMHYVLDHMNPNDTFQVLAFNSGNSLSSPKPVANTPENKRKARQFVDSLQANGGTWMGPAVEAVCTTPADEHRLRIVTFMTDGYVGNDYEILGMIKKYRGKSRWFSFGTGNSVNRTLIEGMAKEGGGEAEYVLLNSSGDEAGKKFYDRISTPVLTDVQLKVDGLTTKEIYPREVSDVWAEKPLYFKGKYLKAGAGTITITGFAGGKPYEQKLSVNFPDNNTANSGIASMWARAKVDRLMSEDWFGAQSGSPNKEIKDEIVATALEHHIMTQYTSFVAVDESSKTKGDKADKVEVQTELPDGVSREGVLSKDGSLRRINAQGMPGGARAATAGKTATFGLRHKLFNNFQSANSTVDMRQTAYMANGFGGVAGGSGGGSGGGASNGVVSRMLRSKSYNGPAQLQALPTANPACMPPLPVASSTDQLLAATKPMPAKKAEALKELKQSVNEKSVESLGAATDRDDKTDKAERGKGKHADEESRSQQIAANKNLTKLSRDLQALISSPKGQLKLNHIEQKGDNYLIEISIKGDSAKLIALLKAMGLEVVSTSSNGLKIKAFVPLAKVSAIAAQDFVLHLALASDRK